MPEDPETLTAEVPTPVVPPLEVAQFASEVFLREDIDFKIELQAAQVIMLFWIANELNSITEIVLGASNNVSEQDG